MIIENCTVYLKEGKPRFYLDKAAIIYYDTLNMTIRGEINSDMKVNREFHELCRIEIKHPAISLFGCLEQIHTDNGLTFIDFKF